MRMDGSFVLFCCYDYGQLTSGFNTKKVTVLSVTINFEEEVGPPGPFPWWNGRSHLASAELVSASTLAMVYPEDSFESFSTADSYNLERS